MSTDTAPHSPARSLANLPSVQLDERSRQLLRLAESSNGGPLPWQQRKLAEVRDLLALSQASQRFRIERLELFDPLRVLIDMRVDVPCRPDPRGPLQIARRAAFGLIYRQEAIRTAQPGTSFIEVLTPRHILHPNVSDGSRGPQVLCLGPSVSSGVRTRDLVYLVYGTFTLNLIQFDALDPAGVLSPEAAEWWQQPENLKRVPLTREPFLYQPETQP